MTQIDNLIKKLKDLKSKGLHEDIDHPYVADAIEEVSELLKDRLTEKIDY